VAKSIGDETREIVPPGFRIEIGDAPEGIALEILVGRLIEHRVEGHRLLVPIDGIAAAKCR
jgi:hypothetical protein